MSQHHKLHNEPKHLDRTQQKEYFNESQDARRHMGDIAEHGDRKHHDNKTDKGHHNDGKMRH